VGEGAPAQFTSDQVNSYWNMQLNNSYGPDYNGYGPGVVLYYQNYAGESCGLSGSQIMKINTDTGQQQYSTNTINWIVMPGQVSVQRGNATATTSFPAQ
jgi:hypothetical protein